MINRSEKICPRCDAPKMKSWAELNDDEQFLAKRLEKSAEYSPVQRKKHRFCTRCWLETAGDGPTLA